MHRPPRRLGFQLAHAPQDVAQALLVCRRPEPVVRREATLMWDRPKLLFSETTGA